MKVISNNFSFPKKAYSKYKYKIYKKVEITIVIHLLKRQWTNYNIKKINLITTKLIFLHQTFPTDPSHLEG